MRHLIVGAGVIGKAFGIWLHANKETVIFNDIDLEKLAKLGKKGYLVLHEKTRIKEVDPHIIWICTAEWHVEDVIKQIPTNLPIVVRSTMKPRELYRLKNDYSLLKFAHVPEFLTQNNALLDIFNEDRVIIGTDNNTMREILSHVYKDVTVPVVFTSLNESALIKYTSNTWLAMCISYWNEIKQLCDCYDNVNPQLVADATTLDKRISKYGSGMFGWPFGGFCFPKDTKALIEIFKEFDIAPDLLNGIIKVNKKMEDKLDGINTTRN